MVKIRTMRRGAALPSPLVVITLLCSRAGGLTASRTAAWVAPACTNVVLFGRALPKDSVLGIRASRSQQEHRTRPVPRGMSGLSQRNLIHVCRKFHCTAVRSGTPNGGEGTGDVRRGAPEDLHISVLPDEVREAFIGVQVRTFIDGTLGMGGHALSICESHTATLETLLGIDQDPDALQLAAQRLAQHSDKVRLVSGNFVELLSLAEQEGIKPGQVDGVLLDIGTSSLQLDEAQRGFSFMRDGPLDMRMNPSGALTAADIVNTWAEEDIARVLWEYGEERRSRSIARKVVAARETKQLETTAELCRVIGGARYGKGNHPATLTFQALRIAVNEELHVLANAIPQAVKMLAPGGRLAVISFHSLEDRIVKQSFREITGDEGPKHKNKYAKEPDEPTLAPYKLVHRRPIVASAQEQKTNSRSRSAKLRVLERIF